LQVDLVLVVVVYTALAAGPVAGLWVGTIAGLAQDVLSGGIVGVGGLVKTLVGFLAGVVGSQFIVTGVWHRFVIFFGATLLHVGAFLGLSAVVRSGNWAASPSAVLAQALATAGLGVLAGLVIESSPGLLERRRLRRMSVTQRRLGNWEAR